MAETYYLHTIIDIKEIVYTEVTICLGPHKTTIQETVGKSCFRISN